MNEYRLTFKLDPRGRAVGEFDPCDIVYEFRAVDDNHARRATKKHLESRLPIEKHELQEIVQREKLRRLKPVSV
ncbi:MAG TPA: hypothetical protein VJI33_03705 [Candidatus Paceibacterota bacterium]